MAQFIPCSTNFDIITLIMALIDDVSTLSITNRNCGVRTIAKTIASEAPFVTATCATKEDLMQLFRLALGVADDGRMALNVVYTAHNNGSGLSQDCGMQETVWQRLSRCFVNTSDGEVAVYIANIT